MAQTLPPDDSTVLLNPLGDAVGRPAGGSQNALAIGTQLGEFEIIDLIGEGGFGIVYLAQDHSLHRKVALKEYMPASLAARNAESIVSVRSERQRETFGTGLRSFVNEARILAQYDHPALIKVYRFWEANGTAYMAMPYLEGQTLSETLRARVSPPDEAWIRQHIGPVMEALETIHRDNCFHRDIAPDNIFILKNDRPILLDFGAARRVISDMTQALTVILKPGYAPIEQYAEMPGMKQGPWTDIYALAAVLHFMVAERKPPPSVSRIVQDDYESLLEDRDVATRYSTQFLRGIDRCLAVKAEDRPQDIAAMREALGFNAPLRTAANQFQNKAPKATPAPANSESTKVKKSLSPMLLGGVALTLAALGGGGYWLSQRNATTPNQVTTNVVAPQKPSATATTPAPSAPTKTLATSNIAEKRFTNLDVALEGLQQMSHSTVFLQLDPPARHTVGQSLPISLTSTEPGYMSLFAWAQESRQIYRLPLPEQGKVGANIPIKFNQIIPWLNTEQRSKLRLIAVFSALPRKLKPDLFSQDAQTGIAAISQTALEDALTTQGLTQWLGTVQCEQTSCPEMLALQQSNIDLLPADAAANKAASTKSSPTKKTDKPNDRESIKRLNQNLDQILGN